MIIPNLTSFDIRKLQIYGRKEITEYPAGKHRERLIFFLHYIVPASPEFIGPVQSTSGVFTFTSKNAPPYLEYITDTELAGIKNNLKSTFFSPYASAEYGEPYHNQLMMPGRNFKVAVEQPYSSGRSV